MQGVMLLKTLQNLKDVIYNDKCKEYFLHGGWVSLFDIIEFYMPKYCANDGQDLALSVLKSIFELIN